MYTATIKLESTSGSPLSFSRMHLTEKLAKEGPDDYEKRTWKERLHVAENGDVFIPPMALKNSIDNAAQYNSRRIPGKGQATYTKHVRGGVLCCERLMLGIQAETVDGEWIACSADGVKGGGKRVLKCFPIIREWKATTTVVVGDETVTQDVFSDVLREAGLFIGLLRFRPANGGYYGRFEVKGIKFS